MQDSISIQAFPTNGFDVPFILSIHRDFHYPILNLIIPYLRLPQFWIPLYIVLIYLLIRWYKKYWWLALSTVIATVSFSDFTNSSLIKKWVQRPRPCNESELRKYLDVLVHCGSGYSFMSSHACNHMAIGMFFFLIFRQRNIKNAWIFLLWASLVGFAQVYVGVHYPFDVMTGLIYGALIGYGGFHLLNFALKRLTRNKALV